MNFIKIRLSNLIARLIPRTITIKLKIFRLKSLRGRIKSQNNNKIITTRLTGGLLYPYKGMLPASA